MTTTALPALPSRIRSCISVPTIPDAFGNIERIQRDGSKRFEFSADREAAALNASLAVSTDATRPHGTPTIEGLS